MASRERLAIPGLPSVLGKQHWRDGVGVPEILLARVWAGLVAGGDVPGGSRIGFTLAFPQSGNGSAAGPRHSRRPGIWALLRDRRGQGCLLFASADRDGGAGRS